MKEGVLELGLFPTRAFTVLFQICVRQGGESALFLCVKSLSLLIHVGFSSQCQVSDRDICLGVLQTDLLGQKQCSWLESFLAKQFGLFCKK